MQAQTDRHPLKIPADPSALSPFATAERPVRERRGHARASTPRTGRLTHVGTRYAAVMLDGCSHALILDLDEFAEGWEWKP